MDHTKTPILTALIEYANRDITCFDVPGHKRGNYLEELKEVVGEMTLKLDVNASKTMDNLSYPTGVIKEAEELIADAFSASNGFILVNGSTSGVQYMIMSAIENGDKILIPRNVHKSAINALILAGGKPVFMELEVDEEYGIANGVSLKSVKQALDLNDDIKAIFLINPTYFGVVSDIESIINLAHKRNIPVLVDQAHGAHFSFHKGVPVNASIYGADLVTLSMHKTGGSLTQSSVLLHNEGLISKNMVRSTINLLQTTSASYLLMASVDLARKQLVLEGYKRLGELLKLTTSAKHTINSIDGLSCIVRDEYAGVKAFDYDELKIVIKVTELGVSGFFIYDLLLSDYDIQVELAEPNVIMAIVSFGDDEKSICVLLDALKDISKRFYKPNNKKPLTVLPALKNPKLFMSPREAFYHDKKLMHISETAGLISGESIMIYPPGIPLVIPGEMITQQLIDHYIYLRNEGSITLNDDDDPMMIKILDKSEEKNPMDLWYTENHQEDVKFSIKVKEHLHSEKSEFQQLDFFTSDTFGKFFTLDGLMMVTEKDEFIYHDMITHVSMAVNPDIKRVLVIGGGDGGTVREVLRYDHVEHVDMVEIDERVVRLCQKYLPQTACKMDNDERLTLHFEDGLKFVQDAEAESYDLILVDSTDPIGPGEGLFTYEFYNNCKRVLSEDGILINQHESPYYDDYAHEMKRSHSKIKETFPIAEVYQFHMPTYPSGHWLFGFASKKYDPIKDLKADQWNALGLKTKYYNTDIHVGAFMLPSYVRDELKSV